MMLLKFSSEEKFSDIFIVPGTPFLYIKSIDLLVFADAHLGFEEAVARGLDYHSGRHRDYRYFLGGMIIPKRQLRRLIEYFEVAFRLLEKPPKTVLVDGDLKHAFDRLLRQERIEVMRLIEYLFSRKVENIVLVRGNHDNYLPLVLRDYGLELHKSYEVNAGSRRILFVHGHFKVDPSDYDIIIMGHEHPVIRCFGLYRFPVFAYFDVDGATAIVLPASGAYQPGTVLSLHRENYLSPMIREYANLESMRLIVWIQDIGETAGLTMWNESFSPIEEVRVDGKYHAYVRFESLEDAMLMCGL
jgi:putative SbcD/Mre11-related phosphoesterase